MMNEQHTLQEPVYIPSIEASTIYEHVHRGRELYLDYVGMIPKSLELEALVKNKMNINKKGKRKSDDIISVQFNTKVRDASELEVNFKRRLATINKQIDELQIKLDNLSKDKDKSRVDRKLQKRTASKINIESKIKSIDHSWQEVGLQELRTDLYSNGFVINGIKYVVYKRSTSKSRTGSVLFIRQELHDNMTTWTRMGLNFTDRDDVDYVGLLAYESLVGSSIIDTITLSPSNMFIIADYTSIFKQEVNLVSVDDMTGLLSSTLGEATIRQVIWDGQALLDESFFAATDRSMYLLRNHFFKAASFRCNVQKFLCDSCPTDVKYEDWILVDMFGNVVYAKDILCITTPSALKFLKFSHLVGTENEMWSHWSKLVEGEGSIFGVVKYEKESKFGNSVHELSYQMVNSLPASKKDIDQLAEFQIDFIENLKNNLNAFIEYAEDTQAITNGNEMMISLYKHNPRFANTKMFRGWKSQVISDYTNRVKSGKLRIDNSDYGVLLSNPIEMLHAVVGKFDGNPLALSGNQVYTNMYSSGDRIAAFRSPHSSPSNIAYLQNTSHKLINYYLPKLSKNIVVINSIGFPILEQLSGADMDSDTMLMSNNNVLVDMAQLSNDKYKVCVNNVSSDKTQYVVNLADMAKIDNQLSNSQTLIGQVTNAAQLLMSNIWTLEAQGIDCNEMWDKMESLTVLSGLVIDLAKRMPKLDIEKQIIDAKKVVGMLKNKPYWWHVRNKEVARQGNKKIKILRSKNIDVFDCPMDHLYEIITDLTRVKSDRYADVSILSLLVKHDAGKANNKQLHNITDILEDYADKFKETHAKNVNKDEKERLNQERQELVEDVKKAVRKYKIKDDTRYAIISKIIKDKVDNNTIRFLNILFQADKKWFLSAFKMDKYKI